MSGRAMEGACLARRVRMAIPRCKAAERICRRSGPGAPPTYADWQVATLTVVAVLARRKSKRAPCRYLFGRRKGLMKWLGLRTFPGRSTYFDRYRHAYELFQASRSKNDSRRLRRGRILAENPWAGWSGSAFGGVARVSRNSPPPLPGRVFS